MNAIISSSDKRRAGGMNPNFLDKTTYEDVYTYIKKHKKAYNVLLLSSPKHKEEGAFYTREEYLKFMYDEQAKTVSHDS